MKNSLRMAVLILVVAVLPAVARAQVQGAGDLPGILVSEASGTKTVNLQIKDAPVMEALNLVAKAGNISFAVKGELPKSRVTVNLQDTDARGAFMLVCAAAGIEFELSLGGGFVVSSAPTATVAGAQVPVLGALSVGGGDPEEIRLEIMAVQESLAVEQSRPRLDPERLLELAARLERATTALNLNFRAGLYSPSSGPMTLPGLYGSIPRNTTLPGVLSQRAPFPGEAILADLVGQGLSLREVARRLSESSGVSIVVDKSLSDGLAVTASIHSLPLGQALSMLVSQAHLTYTVGATADGKPEIHIVPPSSLQVSVSLAPPAGGKRVAEVPVTWRATPDRDNRGERGKWYSMSFDDSAWPTVSTAHMWCLQEGPLKSLSGSYAWGRVKFSVDPKWRGRRIMLRIVALDEQGTVYLNGERVAGPGAFADGWIRPLDIEVTGKLRFDRPNVLAVRAYAKSTVGGVYRPVILYSPAAEISALMPGLTDQPANPVADGAPVFFHTDMGATTE